MKPMDLKDLINGLLAVIFFAIAIGQYDRLRGYAVWEVVRALEPAREVPTFFPGGTRR